MHSKPRVSKRRDAKPVSLSVEPLEERTLLSGSGILSCPRQPIVEGVTTAEVLTRDATAVWGVTETLEFTASATQVKYIHNLFPGQRIRYTAKLKPDRDGPAGNVANVRVADHSFVLTDSNPQRKGTLRASGSTLTVQSLYRQGYDAGDVVVVQVQRERIGNLKALTPEFTAERRVNFGFEVDRRDSVFPDGQVYAELWFASQPDSNSWDLHQHITSRAIDLQEMPPGSRHQFQLDLRDLGKPPRGADMIVSRVVTQNSVSETTKSDNVAGLLLPNLKSVAARVRSDGRIGLQYQVTGSQRIPMNGENAFHVQAFWATGASFGDRIGNAFFLKQIAPNPGAVKELVIPNDQVSVPVGATHLLGVVDPWDNLPESNEDDNVAALRLPNLKFELAEWNRKGGVTVHYDVERASLPQGRAPQVELYWASGNSGAEASKLSEKPFFTGKLKRTGVGDQRFEVPKRRIRRGELSRSATDILVEIHKVSLETVRDDNNGHVIGGNTPTSFPRKSKFRITAAATPAPESDSWTFLGKLTRDDGLAVKNLKAGKRTLANLVNIPYLEIRTAGSAEPIRAELRKNSNASVARSRLIAISNQVVDENKNGFSDRYDPYVLEATYLIDRLPTGSGDNDLFVKLTQRYEFYSADEEFQAFAPIPQKMIDLISAFLPAGIVLTPVLMDALAGPSGPPFRFYPKVEYSVHGSASTAFRSIRVPQRFDVHLDSKSDVVSAVGRDRENGPLPTKFPPAFVDFVGGNPLERERAFLAIKKGRAVTAGLPRRKTVDNVHFDTFRNRIDAPVDVADNLLGFHLPPGSLTAWHIHWRWNSMLGFPNSELAGKPIIPKGSNQTVTVGITLDTKGSHEPDSWRDLLNRQRVANRDQVFWYESFSRGASDKFFIHGSFIEKLDDIPKEVFDEIAKLNETGS